MRNTVQELLENQNVRSNLSNLRAMIKETKPRADLKKMLKGHEEFVISLLDSEDAKTRRNAALLIGDLEWEQALDKLYETYVGENTLFVKSSYLQALYNIDSISLLSPLKERMKEILATEQTNETRKHADEELRAIRKILIKYEGISRHSFQIDGKKHELVLITNRNHREIVRRQITCGEAKLHPLGVSVETADLAAISQIRTYREIVFPIHTDGLVGGNPEEIGQALWEADLYSILTDLHKEDEPFYYRIDCKNGMDLEERSRFSKKLAACLEQQSGGRLVNSAADYEIEIRLIANKEGKYFSCLKLNTMPDTRFDYRKNAISASIHPSTAALIMELSKPYLKEEAQIMDPFCGVGTMLIERNLLVPAREMYGTDIFGDAIVMARENTELARAKVNYIHRDFFDFKHEYKFDELITNMPVKGKKTREELDKLYDDFFTKVPELFGDTGTIIMYTNEMGLVKKQLRLRREYRLLQETCMQTKTNFFLLIIGYEV